MFTATHRYRATKGDPSVLVQVVLLDPEFAYGRQALVLFEDRDTDKVRVSASSLMALDECSCEFSDTGDGESGPRLDVDWDPSCPVHQPTIEEIAREAEIEAAYLRSGGEAS